MPDQKEVSSVKYFTNANNVSFEILDEEWRRENPNELKLDYSLMTLYKSMDWFLYDKDLRHERVNSSNYIIFYVRKRNQDPQKALS